MKKIILGMVLLLAGTVSSIAQTKNITVTGTVIEADTKQPILQASVRLLSLPDSTFAAGVATLSNGRFTLPKVAAGKYVLHITYIGLQPQYVPLQLNANNLNRNTGTIALESDAILLQEAVITAEAPPVTVKADTTEYAASAYRVPEGSMLEELVKKLPGAEVSEDGTITVNGKEIKKIMVDGKEFFTDDPKVAMKNLPVNMVEKVKAYDKKSDMARITGIDDGEEETVLDLTVKKGMKQGWIGNLIAGYGNKDRYEAGGMISRFQDNSSLSIIGSLNNTNNKGFSEFGDAGQGLSGGGAGSGITTARSLGVNFAQDSKKLQVGGNVQYGYSDNDAQSKSTTERFLGEESSFENALNASRRKRHDVRADFRLEWRPDSMTTVIFRPNASYSRTEANSNSWSETLADDRSPVNDKNSNTFSKSNNLSFNGRLEAFRKLNNNGRNISLRANFGYSDGETNSISNSETTFFEPEPDSIVSWERTTDRNSDSRNWSVSASYTEPVFKNHFLQLRYEFAHRKRLSESLVSDPDSLAVMPNGYVESLSSRVENFYDTHSIDASIRGIHPKMMYSAGLTLTPQSSRSETTIGPNSSKQLPTQNVTNFAPQVMFRYMFNKQHVLMLRYRGRSSEPNIEDLQQVIDQTDPLNIRYGNPNLKPSFTHNVMMFYNKYIPEHMRSYSMNLFYSNTQNSVANQTSYDPSTGGTVSKKVNVNGNWNARGYFSFNTPLKNRKYTISSNANAQFRDQVSYTSVERRGDAPTEGELSTTHNLTLGERLTGSYRADKFDISLNASINYNLARNSKQVNSNRETFDYYLGGSTNITLPWELYLSTDLNYRIKDGYSGDFNTNEMIWNAQVSKNLLKNKATLRFKIYDILKEQSNLSRTITETRMSDVEYNTLGSYFMVHFVYRLNTLGGKSSARRGGFGPGEGRGPRGYGGGPRGGGPRF
ncbi:TonB-dependent receptor [Bacteroides sp. 51]|uniref:TonB-dependent receptor n=1 Tax=Bacteroides sp. 51 TaxID=2302938 RepID=UPI0013D74DC2|nr:outer membrane beta-barrel protein [Bacteroides sp. 51]NDV81803.1 hypothetical protein [Bacteroides sp. 51]